MKKKSLIRERVSKIVSYAGKGVITLGLVTALSSPVYAGAYLIKNGDINDIYKKVEQSEMFKLEQRAEVEKVTNAYINQEKSLDEFEKEVKYLNSEIYVHDFVDKNKNSYAKEVKEIEDSNKAVGTSGLLLATGMGTGFAGLGVHVAGRKIKEKIKKNDENEEIVEVVEL